MDNREPPARRRGLSKQAQNVRGPAHRVPGGTKRHVGLGTTTRAARVDRRTIGQRTLRLRETRNVTGAGRDPARLAGARKANAGTEAGSGPGRRSAPAVQAAQRLRTGNRRRSGAAPGRTGVAVGCPWPDGVARAVMALERAMRRGMDRSLPRLGRDWRHRDEGRARPKAAPPHALPPQQRRLPFRPRHGLVDPVEGASRRFGREAPRRRGEWAVRPFERFLVQQAEAANAERSKVWMWSDVDRTGGVAASRRRRGQKHASSPGNARSRRPGARSSSHGPESPSATTCVSPLPCAERIMRRASAAAPP